MSVTAPYKGMLYALAGFTGFACADACAKWLGAFYSVPLILLWTYLISLLVGLALSPWLGGLKDTLRTRHIFIQLGRGVCAMGISACAVTALSGGLPLANLYTVMFLSPFLATLLAWPLFKERLSAKGLGIIALGFTGILIALRPGFAEITPPTYYALAALGFIVVLSLLARPLGDKETLLSLSFFPAIVITVSMLALNYPAYNLPAPSHVPVFILNGICVTLGLCGIAQGFRIAPFAIIAPIHYIQMIIAIALGALIFGDFPDIWMLSGAAIIILSGLALIGFVKNGPASTERMDSLAASHYDEHS